MKQLTKSAIVILLIFAMTTGLLPIGSPLPDWTGFAPDVALAQGDFSPVMSMGRWNSMYVDENNELWVWGWNEDGDIGIGISQFGAYPTPIKLMSDVIGISSGDRFNMAIKSDGSLWAWGAPWSIPGRTFEKDFQTTPIWIMDDVKYCAAGWAASYAIKNDNSLWGWGDIDLDEYKNAEGWRYSDVPVKIMEDVAMIYESHPYSTGHTMAVKTDGSLWAWGSNYRGKLGDGTYSGYRYVGGQQITDPDNDRWTPVKVMDNVVSVALGDLYSFAVKTDGTLWAWGANNGGQLGDGGTTDQASPIKIMDNVAKVATAPASAALALKTDGSLWYWYGYSTDIIVNGIPIVANTPVRIWDDIADISTGEDTYLVRRTDGSLWSWGVNWGGQYGNGEVDTGFSWATDSSWKTFDPVRVLISGDDDDDDITAGGTFGNITWSLEKGVLVISGTGDMPWRILTGVFPWYEYRDVVKQIQIGNGITSIASDAFADFSALTSVSIGTGVTKIEYFAFARCTELRTVAIPWNITSIGDSAFLGCEKLSSITIPPSVTTIGSYVLDGCPNVTVYCYALSAICEYALYMGINADLLDTGANYPELGYGRDTFQFINHWSAFFNNQSSVSNGYEISSVYYDILIKGRTNDDKVSIKENKEAEWGGSCFGMSSVLALTRAGRLNPASFENSWTNLYGMNYPKNSLIASSIINYYQLILHTSAVLNEFVESDSQVLNVRSVIEKIAQNTSPVIINYVYNNGGGHAVVGYGLYIDNYLGKYIIPIYDPNNNTSIGRLVIDWDCAFADFEPFGDFGERGSTFICGAISAESSAYKNIVGSYSTNNSSTRSAALTASSLSALSSGNTYLYTNFTSFRVDSSSGEYAVFEGGSKTEGDLVTSVPMYLNEVGADIEMITKLPNLYTGETYTVQSEGVLSSYKVALRSTDEQSGFYSSVKSENNGSVIFGADGAVSVTCNTLGDISASLTTNDSGRELYTITAEGVATNLSLSPDDSDVLLSSETSEALKITASGDYNSVTADDVLVDADGVIIKEVSRNIVILDSDDNEVFNEEIGYSIIFYSLGGEPLEALFNILGGTVVSLPTPVREGYVFDGWFTDEDLINKWEFASPVTSDLILYAKWSEGTVAHATGDINGDGKIDLQDVLLIYQHLLRKVELKEQALEAADVNIDGTVSMADVLALYLYFRGKTLSLTP